MSHRRSAVILLACAFALTGVLVAAMGMAKQNQQPAPRKTDASNTSCLYDFEMSFIANCIQTRPDGELFIKRKVLKRLQFASDGLAPVLSQTYGWMYVSRGGRILITGVPMVDNWADTFHDGLVRVVKNNKYGFSNRAGDLVISPVYDGALNFENGKATVCNHCPTKCVHDNCEYRMFSGGEWFEIDTKGTVVSRIQAEY
jgi:hypothetical protein